MNPNELELWRRRQEELLQEAEHRYLVRRLRAARRKKKQIGLLGRLRDRHSWPKSPVEPNAPKLEFEKCPEAQK